MEAMKVLVFNNEADALKVVAKINAVLSYPKIGRHRGVLNPDKQQTTTWYTPQQTIGGKWIVRVLKIRISKRLRDKAKAWLDNQGIAYTVEDFNPGWFPE